MIKDINICGVDLKALENYCGHIENLIGTRPNQIVFDCFNNEVHIDFKHDDFLKIFGPNFDMKEINPLGNTYILERKFWTNKGTKLIINTTVNEHEIINKFMAKYGR